MLMNFYTLLLIIVTLSVILSRRTRYSILFLILLFALVAVFVYSLGVDFIGLIFVIVYVGAIATLFLFIVRMLGGEDWDTRSSVSLESINLLMGSGFVGSRLATLLNQLVWYTKHLLFDLFLVFVFGLLFLNLMSTSVTGNLTAWLDLVQLDYSSNRFTSSFLYGVFFYDHWYLPLILAGAVLFIARLGSIILTTRLVAGVDSSKLTSPNNKTKLASHSEDAFAKLVEKQKLEFERPVSWWLPQLIWSVVCVVVGFLLKDVCIVSAITRWIYIAVVTRIYLFVSFKMSNYLAAKRVTKSRK